MSVSKIIRNRSRRLVKGQSAVYHVVSRCALSTMLLDYNAKGMFVRMMWRQAAFAGVEVLSYCVMTNHFHMLVRVPEPHEISDTELMRRYRCLYGESRPFSAADPDVLEQLLEAGGEDADVARKRILARMHDLPAFVSELKQRFSIWYNKNHHNRGTVWSERFRSIIVEDAPEYTAPVAAYIDLNPVRAQIVSDPSDYAFSSYGAAMQVNDIKSKNGLVALYQYAKGWRNAIRSYRVLLYGKGAQFKGNPSKDTGMIDPERARQVIDSGGKLSWAEMLRMQIGYFTRGGVLGSKAFLSTFGGDATESTGGGYALKGVDSGMCSLRNLRVNVLG